MLIKRSPACIIQDKGRLCNFFSTVIKAGAKRPTFNKKIIVKSTRIVLLVVLAGLISCRTLRQKTTALSDNKGFVRISTKYPAYFETTDNKTWLPVMINYIVPSGQEETAAFATIENYFRNFSSNGGNAMRIWISSPFLEIEDEKAGQYNPKKFARIDRVLQLAEKYNIRIKFTLQHIRTITAGQAKQPWANSTILSADNGGPFTGIKEYINTAKGKKYYMDRVRALSERYKNSKQIFGWELWNEMDAVDTKDWLAFTKEILDSVKVLFPHHLVTQTLGSLHSQDAANRYEEFFALQNNPYVSLHRYIDPGKDWSQYDDITRPVDSMVFQAVQFAQNNVQNKPIVVNEIGAVEANHAGPSKLYLVDTAGVLIHDMIFAPFFCGAAGTGGLWHWDSYVERQHLWYHYKRFQNAIKGIDPVEERFIPFNFANNGVRAYGLKGKNQTIIWCRNAENNWKTEFLQNIPPTLKTGFSIRPEDTGKTDVHTATVYDPWKDEWTTAEIKNGNISVPAFLRSVVIIIK